MGYGTKLFKNNIVSCYVCVELDYVLYGSAAMKPTQILNVLRNDI